MEVPSPCIHEIRGGPHQITRPVSAKQRETRTRLRRTVVRIPEISDQRKTSWVGVGADVDVLSRVQIGAPEVEDVAGNDAVAGARERVAADGQRFLQASKHPPR